MIKSLFLILGVVTTLNHGLFHSTCSVVLETDYQTTSAVVDSLFYDLQTDINRLFDWAFVGAGSANEDEKDAIIVEYLDTQYDPISKIGQVKVNVHVKGLRTFKNIVVGSVISDSLSTVDTKQIRRKCVVIKYSGSLLKLANATFHIEPLGSSKTQLTLETNCKFGFFFSLFVSRKVYQNILEWRMEQMMLNLKEMAQTGRVTVGNIGLDQIE